MTRASRIPSGLRLLHVGETVPVSGPVKFTYDNGVSWEDALSGTGFRGHPWPHIHWIPVAVPDVSVDFTKIDEGGVV